MITDEKHAELRNVMTPIVNYFAMLQTSNKVTDSTKQKFNELLDSEYKKIINVTLPKVKEILSNELQSVNRNEAEKEVCDHLFWPSKLYKDLFICDKCKILVGKYHKLVSARR